MENSLAALSTEWAFHTDSSGFDLDYFGDFCRRDCSFLSGGRRYLAAESPGQSLLLNLRGNLDDPLN